MKESRFWYIHMLSGLIIFILLGAHIVAIHLSGFFKISYEESISWKHVLERSRDIVWLVVYLLLLFFGLFHGSYGIRGILLETPLFRGKEKLATVLITVVGITFFVLGTISALVVFLRGERVLV